ncbi:MAG: cbb3-type cytochrome c oxidase subunit I [Bryobacterales bacterium]|nr:cbb3-type cytochrome c oxidase subunit I [Bryobacterales bacterium]
MGSVAVTQPEARKSSELLTRVQTDRSCRQTVLIYYVSAVFWLLVGTVLALLASLKMHIPGFLADWDWLTFGRVRPAHLNAMNYGWAAMAAVGTMLWLQSRLGRVRLPFPLLLPVTGIVWNVGLAYGLVAILIGYSSSTEWLEMPVSVLGFFGFCLVILIYTSVIMMTQRKVHHTYVSQWYLYGAIFWFPFLYISALILTRGPHVNGAVRAIANWWFAHNVLGLWVTPIGLASAYYFIPKVTGRPVHSYHLSLLGFWTLALFYNWAGTHHLVGGPIPAWVVTVGIVGSMMMFIPVSTVAINHHMTMVGRFHMLRTSPTLRFVVFGAMSYTLVSVQGSLTALRSVNEVTHFTHYTIGHSHLGMYSFITMMMFGAMYYIFPRILRREWASARLIKIHFWTTAVGGTLYVVALTWAGIEQGLMMNNPDIPFMDVVRYTVPWLASRSVAATLMTIGHLVFAYLVWRILRGDGEELHGPTLFTSARSLRMQRGRLARARVEGSAQ